jgi:hypothetical protein
MSMLFNYINHYSSNSGSHTSGWEADDETDDCVSGIL